MDTFLQGIHVVRTASPTESGTRLGQLTRLIERRYLRSGDLHTEEGPPGAPTLADFNEATSRKNAKTAQEALAQMLFQIPGIAPPTAQYLSSCYKSLPLMIRELSGLSRAEAIAKVSGTKRAEKGLGAATCNAIGVSAATKICDVFLEEY